MASATTSATPMRHQVARPSPTATPAPTSTGAIAAGNVRGRAPATHTFTGSRSLRELLELGPPPAEVGVLALLRLPGHVVEERRVAGQLLDASRAVVGHVQRRPQPAER